ncbi:MAG: class E sortase, partial [Mycobacteriales bacterium]
VIVEGVARGDLRRGPGHYPGSAMPGQVGNFAVAGHRTTYGAPFGRLDELRPGDAIVLETRASWLTYRVTGTRVVAPNEVAVTAPVPDAPGRQPTQASLTLTTCNPRYSARQRLVVFGLLAKTVPNAGGSAPVGASAAE